MDHAQDTKPEAGQSLDRRSPSLFVLAALVGVAALGVYSAGRRLWADYHERTAETLIQKGSIVEAEDHLRRALQVRPSNARLQLQLARTARRAEDYAQAEESLAACQQLGRNYEDAVYLEHVLLAIQRQDKERGDKQPTLEHQDHLLAWQPDAAEFILEAFARGFIQIGNMPKAVACLDRLLDEQPDHYQGRLLRAWIRESFQLDDEALADYQHAVEVNAEATKGRLGLARALYRLGRVREAHGHLAQLRVVQPLDPETLLYLARCCYDAHDLDEAERTLDALLAEQPGHLLGLIERGRVAFRRVNAAEAERWLQKAVDIPNTDPTFQKIVDRCDAYFHLHLYQKAQGKDEAARESAARGDRLKADLRRVTELNELLPKSPRDGPMNYELGIILLRLGYELQGIHALNRAMEVPETRERAKAALAAHAKGQTPH
jgi:tetratricopeptide (TPR) repeat protein